MNTPALLLARLDAIGASLAARDSALALLALGSVGTNRHRLDHYSDLDFFVVVREGSKANYLANLEWMEHAHPVAWAFQNTPDGHKLLYADGIFCEYAVFEPAEMAHARHPGGRIVWHRPDFDTTLCTPRHVPEPPPAAATEWLVGEALTNLYVGLSRYLRGEKWTAALFVQNYAVHRVADLMVLADGGGEAGRDPYTIDRRFEERHPAAREILARCMQGYERTPQSAREILAFLEQQHPVNPHIKSRILNLCEEAGAPAHQEKKNSPA